VLCVYCLYCLCESDMLLSLFVRSLEITVKKTNCEITVKKTNLSNIFFSYPVSPTLNFAVSRPCRVSQEYMLHAFLWTLFPCSCFKFFIFKLRSSQHFFYNSDIFFTAENRYIPLFVYIQYSAEILFVRTIKTFN